MKKIIGIISCVLAFSASLCGLAGCGFSAQKDSFDVVCTIFPQYDWVRKIADGNEEINLTLLQDSGADLHNYQPSPADKIKILNCDLFVYVGGESDEWVEDMLADPQKNPGMKVLKLLDNVNALDEEDVPGSEGHDGGEEEEEEKDEHIWLSLKNAQLLCRAIAEALQSVDSKNATLYGNNLNEYLAELDALEKKFAEAAENPKRRILLFGDRFPFRYLAEDYDLQCFAAFSGCSAETEVSPGTIKGLAEKVDEYGLPYILVLENSDPKLAEQIKNATASKDQTILEMNSIQSVTEADIEEGINYLTLMEKNLETLKTALN